MTQASIDVVGIGNAIVDVIAHAEDAFLAQEALVKGTMTLVDAARAEALYRMMGPAIEASCGSAGNTMAGIASLGGKGAYIGKVRDDFLGQVFRHDITAIGVRFDTAAATSGPGTARCLILVTPDGQRTMNTYLGACVDLGPPDIDPDVIAAAQITYLEGYLFDPPKAQEAFRRAAAIAHAAVRGHVAIAALTRSAEGSVILALGAEHRIDPAPVVRVVDTTGAGDLYASGFLYGLTRDLPLPTCGEIGSLCAAEIISHVSARPETALSRLVAEAGLG